MAEATLELRVGAAQGAFWIDVEMTRQVDHREQQVAQLILQTVVRGTGVDLGLELVELAVNVGDDMGGIGPVEADTGRALLQLGRTGQGREPGRHAVERRGTVSMPLGRRSALGRLLGLPVDGLGFGAVDTRLVAEDMGMAPDHLLGNATGDVVEGEVAGFLGHAGVEDDLEQQVAQLVLQVREVLFLDRVGDLVGLLDRVGRDGVEVLFARPRGSRSRGRAAAP